MNTDKRSIGSILKLVWIELMVALAALAIGIFLRWFAQGYGASDAAPLYAGVSFAMAAFFGLRVIVITALRSANPLRAWWILQTVMILSAVGAVIVALVATHRHMQGTAVLGWGIAAVGAFCAGIIFPGLKPEDPLVPTSE